jgi:signal transduction protein with GAF and PtsI domain
MFVKTISIDRVPAEEPDLALLREFAEYASSAAPLSELLNHAVKFVANIVGSGTCMIYALEDGEFVLRASTHTHPDVLSPLRITLSQEAISWALNHPASMTIPVAAYKDPRCAPFKVMQKDHCEAFILTPMVSAGRVVGIITVQDRARHWHDQREIELLETLAFLVGTKIESVRLQQQNSRIEQKLRDRTIFERAKKILQDRLRISEEDAYLTLQRESKRRRKPMNELAEAIVLTENLKSTCGTDGESWPAGDPTIVTRN